MATLSGWTDGIIMSLLFVIILGGVITGMNTIYTKDYDVGLATSDTYNDIQNLQSNLQSKIGGAEADTASDGTLILSTSWDIIKTATALVWKFLTGSWLFTIGGWLHLPVIVSGVLSVLFFVSMGFVILRLLFKIKP